jgi:hypothetical protein
MKAKLIVLSVWVGDLKTNLELGRQFNGRPRDIILLYNPKHMLPFLLPIYVVAEILFPDPNEQKFLLNNCIEIIKV